MNSKMDVLMQTIVLMEKRLTLVEDQLRLGQQKQDVVAWIKKIFIVFFNINYQIFSTMSYSNGQ